MQAGRVVGKAVGSRGRQVGNIRQSSVRLRLSLDARRTTVATVGDSASAVQRRPVLVGWRGVAGRGSALLPNHVRCLAWRCPRGVARRQEGCRASDSQGPLAGSVFVMLPALQSSAACGISVFFLNNARVHHSL